jgi:hypothetical protein
MNSFWRDRLAEIAEALATGDWPRLRELAEDSSARQLSFSAGQDEVTAAIFDRLADAAREEDGPAAEAQLDAIRATPL